MKITGNVPYEVAVDENGNWDLDYISSTENDLAILAISQYVLENIIKSLKFDKENSKGAHRKQISELLGRASDAKFGIKELLNHMQAPYLSYQEKLESDATKELNEVRLELLKTDEKVGE